LGFEIVIASAFFYNDGNGKAAMMKNGERIIENKSFHIVEESPIFLPFRQNGCKYFNILGPDGERLGFNQIL